MKIITLMLTTILAFSSCQSVMLDKQGRQDLALCSGACYISSQIRENEERLLAYQKASNTIDLLLKNDEVSGEEVEMCLNEVLKAIFSEKMSDKIVKQIMTTYDENKKKLLENEELNMALIYTKQSIDSGILMAIYKNRPIQIVPPKK